MVFDSSNAHHPERKRIDTSAMHNEGRSKEIARPYSKRAGTQTTGIVEYGVACSEATTSPSRQRPRSYAKRFQPPRQANRTLSGMLFSCLREIGSTNRASLPIGDVLLKGTDVRGHSVSMAAWVERAPRG
jgi:hypothetical protein